jgi:hypothetical protein
MPPAAPLASMGPGRGRTAVHDAARRETGTMHLAHAIAAGGLAARATSRRTTPDESEVADSRDRAIARRAAAVDTAPRVVYAERGRHAAPASVRPHPVGA